MCRNAMLALSSHQAVKKYDPELQIQSETIPFIGNTISNSHGLPFDMSLSLSGVQNKLAKHVEFLRGRLDAFFILRTQKVKFTVGIYVQVYLGC